MSDTTTTLLIAGGVFGYLFIGFLIGTTGYRLAERNCDYFCEHAEGWTLAGAFWPIVGVGALLFVVVVKPFWRLVDWIADSIVRGVDHQHDR